MAGLCTGNPGNLYCSLLIAYQPTADDPVKNLLTTILTEPKIQSLINPLLNNNLLNMETQISAICKSSFFMLRSIAQFKKYLTPHAIESLIHAFITSKLDYCNGLMYGIPKNHLVRLQRVQNTAARLVKSVPKFEHVTPVLRELHWLPVQSRIEFKILLTVYKILNDQAPQYLKYSVCLYEPSICNLRSSHEYLLCVPKSILKSILVSAGDCSLSVVGPKIWNSLPYGIKQSAFLNDFKTNVKTFLFLKAYN